MPAESASSTTAIRTTNALLLDALPPPVPADLVDGLNSSLQKAGLTLSALVAKFKEGRPAALSYLKAAGVERIGDRQKIANALAKSERLGTLKPFLDEEAAISSGLAERGKGTVPFPFATTAAAWLANAASLKQLGNEAFKAGKSAIAVDFYGDAIHAATEASGKQSAGADKEATSSLLASLHANTAASYLKLGQWTEVVSAASAALDLDAANPKALYRRGMAYKHLKKRAVRLLVFRTPRAPSGSTMYVVLCTCCRPACCTHCAHMALA